MHLHDLSCGFQYSRSTVAVGHGLSYTTFNYSDLAVEGSVSSSSNATISFTLANVGPVAGAEVGQLYLAFPVTAGEPPRVLRAFTKVSLGPMATQMVVFTIAPSDVSVWSVTAAAWQVVPGTFGVHIGASSSDLRLAGSLIVSG